VDGEFEFGAAMLGEMARLRPDEGLLASRVSALVVHGDRDDVASHDLSRRLAGLRVDCRFHSVVGADHGFAARGDEDEVLAVTASWLGECHLPS
jgi:pimeloyl-ACP methyl ester carboxylesterase